MSTQTSGGNAAQSPIERAQWSAVKALEWLVTILFAVIFILVVLLVVLRYLFNSTIIGGNEATGMMFIYTTAIGAAVDLARDKHIIVDVFVNLLPKSARRWLDAFNLLVIAALNAFLFYYSLGWIAMVGDSEHPVLHISEGLVQAAIPVGCGLTVLFCLARVHTLVTARPAPAQ